MVGGYLAKIVSIEDIDAIYTNIDEVIIVMVLPLLSPHTT